MKRLPFSRWLPRVHNLVIGTLVGKLGVNLQGAEQLEVKGRVTGAPHRVPVNPVTVDGVRYLFSPRGETSWVKNIRASREGTLRRGGKVGVFAVEEIPDEEKLPVMRAYLDRWGWQVTSIVGVDKNADDATLRGIAPNHPVFRIIPKGSPEIR